MNRDLVLVLTNTTDFYVPERVADAVRARGARALRVDTDLYPEALDLAVGVDPEGRPSVRLGDVDGDEVLAVWHRRLAGPRLPAELEPVVAAGLTRECGAHWTAALDVLADRRHINNPVAEARVEGHKLRQLAVARACGLRVPDTLVTSDPAAARAFCARHGDDVVVKLLTPLTVSMDASGAHVFTRALTPEDLAALEDLRSGPMCFQPRVPAQVELRVTWVEGRSFVGAIGGGGGVDWKATATSGWRPGVLPPEAEAGLGRLMRTLGLSMGSADFIIPPEGPPVFLEVNPSGEWGHLEHFLGLPVSEAIADALLSRPRSV